MSGSKPIYKGIFKQKVDTSKVNLPVIRKWINKEVDKYLPDDEIVADFLAELIEASDEPNIQDIYTQMVDFLGEPDALKICKELWTLLLSAQNDKDGIPEKLVEEEKKRRLEKVEETERLKERNRERNKERNKERNLETTGSRYDSRGNGNNYNRQDREQKSERKTNYNRSRSKSPVRG